MSGEPMPWRYDDGGRAAAGYRGRAGDCATRAIAIALQLPYRDVYAELSRRQISLAAADEANSRKKKGKARAHSARSGIDMRVLRAFLAEAGWIWEPTMRIGSGCQVHLSAGELPGGRIIARCSLHLVAVIDGVVCDTHDPARDGSRCVYGYWYRPWLLGEG